MTPADDLQPRHRRLGRRQWLLGTALLVVVALGTTYAWALASLSHSSFARAIVWQSADAEDWTRFPARPVAAADGATFLKPPSDIVEAALLGTTVKDDAGESTLARVLEESDTRAFLVCRGDQLLLEYYGPGSDREAISTSFSVAKSFVSALVGIAISQGSIRSVEDAVTDYVPELLDRDPRFERVTIGHLLSMSSGLAYEEAGMPWSDDALTYYDPDLRRLALERTTVAEAPGKAFHYNNYNPLLLGLVLERATGQTVASYLESAVWQPMGAQYDASWSLDSETSGFEKMESGINARAVDFARFGMLFAHQGQALDGKQVVPATWVVQSTSPQTGRHPPPGTRYGFYWWIQAATGNPYARGNHGQFIYVVPESDVVIVRLGNQLGYESWPLLLESIGDHAAATAAGGG